MQGCCGSKCAARGDGPAWLAQAHAEMDAHAGSLGKLIELAARDEASGLDDAPWPPHFRKVAGEATRVAPSRARAAAKKARTMAKNEGTAATIASTVAKKKP